MERLPKELEFICKKCTEKHEAIHGKTPHACAFQSFDNEYCPEVENLIRLVQAESEGRIVPNIKEGQVFISQNSVVEHAHWSGDLWMDSLNGLHFVFHEADYDWQAEAKYVHGTFEAAEAALAAKEEE